MSPAVVFFPSQPTFEALTPTRPVQPLDLLWNVACPLQLLYGDRDFLADVLQEADRRLGQWGVEHEMRVYAGAQHAFVAPRGPFAHPEAARASWFDAVAFAARHLEGAITSSP